MIANEVNRQFDGARLLSQVGYPASAIYKEGVISAGIGGEH